MESQPSDQTKALIPETILEEGKVDERHQMVLHAQLIDLMMLVDVVNARLNSICRIYDFDDFAAIRNYYNEYVQPQLNDIQNESKKDIS